MAVRYKPNKDVLGTFFINVAALSLGVCLFSLLALTVLAPLYANPLTLLLLSAAELSFSSALVFGALGLVALLCESSGPTVLIQNERSGFFSSGCLSTGPSYNNNRNHNHNHNHGHGHGHGHGHNYSHNHTNVHGWFSGSESSFSSGTAAAGSSQTQSHFHTHNRPPF